jgi:N-formylglutamate deformylase
MIEVTHGHSPLILGLPHTGTEIPADCLDSLNEVGRAMADTDWHIDKLYAGLVDGATYVRTPIHRYVIDVNRDPSGISLYPGQNTTGLCPLTDFDGLQIYKAGREPDATEITRRIATYHAPYHAALAAEVARVKALNGFAILYDCHSIRNEIPFLFDGTLPDFNIGTNSGSACAPQIEALVYARTRAANRYTSVLNGRFKGGWTTRHYGSPLGGVHAIQMELAQATHITESPPWEINRPRFDALREHLRAILTDLQNWRPQ